MLGPETILGVRVDYFTDASPQQSVRSVLWAAGGLFNPSRTRVLPWRVGRGGAAADVVVPGDSFPATGWLEAGGGAGGEGERDLANVTTAPPSVGGGHDGCAVPGVLMT